MSNAGARPFGLDHPLWPAPTCFYYKTAEDAWTAIEKVYGPEAAHTVVEVRPVDRPASNQSSTPTPKENR